jgi:hypothetical protein
MSTIDTMSRLERYHYALNMAYDVTVSPINDLGSIFRGEDEHVVGGFGACYKTLGSCFKTVALSLADKAAVYSCFYGTNRIRGTFDFRETGTSGTAAVLRTILLVFSVLVRMVVFTVVLTLTALFSYLIPVLPFVAYYLYEQDPALATKT